VDEDREMIIAQKEKKKKTPKTILPNRDPKDSGKWNVVPTPQTQVKSH
jgi:hypothetical protein